MIATFFVSSSNPASASGSATALAFTTPPAGATGGVAFGTQPVVDITGGSGTSVTVSLSIVSGTGATGAALSCGSVTTSTGVADFSNCSINLAGTGYELVASSAALTSVTSSAFSVAVGAPDQVAFVQQPASVVAGSFFASAPELAVEDAGGNIVTTGAGSTDAIGLSVVSGTGPGPLVCSGSETAAPAGDAPGYKLTASGGTATFTDCTIDEASASEYELVGEATDGTTAGTFVTQPVSNQFTVSSGTPTQLGFTTNPTGAQAGLPFSTQPVVALEDANGNVVTTGTGTITLAITTDSGTSGASLSGCTSTMTGGVATFSGCSINLAGDGYSLTASDATGNLTGTSALLDVSNSAAANLTFTTPPGGGTGGVAWAQQPVVSITDSGGAPVSGTVSLALTGGTAGAHLTCSTDPASAGTGVATFAGCSVDKAGTGYQLVATSGALSVTSATFSVGVGPAAMVAFVTPPSGALGGSPFTAQPEIAVEDLGGNPVAISGDTIALGIVAGTGAPGAELTCTGDPGAAVTTSNSTATFSGCAIDKVGTGYELTATADGFVTTSAPFSVTAGSAAKLVFTTQPTGGTAASPFGSQPQLTVTDAGGNPVGPADATVTLAISGGALSCSNNPLSTTTGVASFFACQASTAGTFTLTATAPNLASVTSAPFTIVSGSPLETTPGGIPTAETYGGDLYAVNPTSVTDDVNSATGSLNLSYTDLNVAGIGEPFSLVREYNSLDTTGGSFGPGWSSIFDAGVTIATGGKTAVVRGEDGQQIVFTSNGNGEWIAPTGARSTLVCSGATCTVTRLNGDNFESIGGRIQDYLSPGGEGLHFVYSGTTLTEVEVQTSGSPLVIHVTENSNGEVTKVATPTRSVSYSYSGTTLTGFTDADGKTWTYNYNSTPALTQVIDPLAQVRLSVTYSGGRVASASQMGSARHFADTYSWNPTTQVSTRNASVQTSTGLTTGAYLDQYKSNVLVDQQLPDGATTAYSYDSFFNLVEMQDPLGHIEQMTYNSFGNILTQSDPYTASATAVTRFGYNASNQLISETDPNGNTTTYTYTGANLTEVTPPGSASGATKYVYNSLGERTETETPTGIETFTYDAEGNQTGFQLESPSGTALNGLGPVTSYNEAGQKLVLTDARGHTASGLNSAFQTVNTYDADGNLLSTTSPGPQTTSTTYTAADDIASTTNPAGQTTTDSWSESTLTLTATSPAGTSTSVYDPSGNLLSTTDEGGQTTSYAYDTTSRQLSETDPDNITTTYAYNLDGDVIASSDTAGNTSTLTYSPQNQVLSTTVNGQTTSETYDADGNKISQTNPDGDVTSYTFNADDEMASVTTAAGTTTYSYDLSGDLTGVKDGDGNTTTYVYNGAGQKTEMIVNGEDTIYTYDAANNLTSVTDPDGRTTTYTLNAQDLRTAITYTRTGQPSINVTQTFNAAGQRTQMTDPTTGTHTYTYDTGGNLISAANGAEGTYTYNYGTPGQMTETYPGGTQVTYTYDDAHSVMSVAVSGSNPLKVSYLRNTDREVTGIAYSNGLLQTDTYNQAGQVTGQSLSCAGVTEMASATSFDAAGNPLGQTTTVGTTADVQSFGYDGSGRVDAQATTTGTAATATTPDPTCTTGTQSQPGSPQQNDSSGTTTDTTAATTANQPSNPAGAAPSTGTTANPLSYDADGNRTSDNGITYTYNKADELVSESGAQTASFTYDNSGDLTSQTINGATTTYAYNPANELVTVTTGSTTVAYAYDGDGNRVSQTVTNGSGSPVVTNYSWDISGNVPLLAVVTDGSGNLIRQYIYGVGPVAMQTPTGTYYLTTDAQGDVTSLSSDAGDLLETYSYDAYGNVTATQVGSTTAPANPLLFQGQYLDTTTGLYDMRARDYDPTTGRFTQPDPVTPQIGTPVMSPYVFAGDQPTVNGDPTGMTSSVVNSAVNGHSTQSASIVADTNLGLKGAIGTAKLVAFAAKAEGAEMPAELDGAGKVIGVAGIALGAYVTVEDCEHGTVAQCVGDTVGLALGTACMVATEGAGAFACGLAAAALGLVISTYGPQIVQGLADLGQYEIEGATIAIDAIGQGFSDAGTAITGAYAVAAGVISTAVSSAVNAVESGLITSLGTLATGFNELSSAISNGYDSAVSTLEQAGYTAVQMADVLAKNFDEGLDTVVNQLADLAYDVDGIADALKSTFDEVGQQAAAVLQQFEYGVDQVGDALKTAYQDADAVAASVLQGLNYTVDQISGALDSVYNDADAAVATVLQGLNFTVDQISGALDSVYNDAAATVAGILNTLNYSLDEIGDALNNVYAETDQELASIYNTLGESATAIAGALQDVYNDTAALAATALQDAGIAIDEVGTALENAYGEAAQAVAGVLAGIGDAASAISGMLTDVFAETTSEIESTLSNFFSNSTIDAISSAFSNFGDDVASAFESAFSWL